MTHTNLPEALESLAHYKYRVHQLTQQEQQQVQYITIQQILTFIDMMVRSG
jgi:hypothetical protein